MATALQILEQKRQELIKGLEDNKDLILTLPADKQKEFRENFLEFATQDYLVSKISVKEIIRFSVNICKLGLNINPAFKEVYIVPFNTKVKDETGKDQHIMLPQAIIPLNGIQEMSYKKNFFLKLYEVYKLGEEVVSEKEMTRAHQMLLKTSDAKWVDENFVGFDVVLTDLINELPEQTKFIEASYLKAVTKTMQDERFKVQSWRHKAVRRAFGDFFIPRSREVDIFDKVEHINDQTLGTVVDASIESKEIKNFIELQEALSPHNISLVFNNGIATASGNTYQNAKTLAMMGFKFANSVYTCQCAAPAIALPNKALARQEDLMGTPVINSLDSMALYLEELGLTMTIWTSNGGEELIGVSAGNTDQLEDKLLAIGFQNKNGKFLRSTIGLKK